MLEQDMTEPEKHPNWGGKRDGAGGPTLEGVRQEPRMICMTPVRWGRVLHLGDGNYSLGVRRLLDFWKERGGK